MDFMTGAWRVLMADMQIDVVGIGAVTGYGWGVEDLWGGLIGGDSSAFPHTGLGGAFPDPCWYARVPEPPEPPQGASTGSTRYSRAVAEVAEEALADAREHGWEPGDRVAVLHATTGADRELWRARYLGPAEGASRRRFVEQVWTTPPGQVMIKNSFLGPSAVLSAACTSGLHAVALAHRLLACGDATDVVVTSADIGYDGEEIRLFADLGALVHDSPPEDVCRPFQEGTRGFVIGEAAAAVVLTAAPHRAGYLRVLSTALGNDAYHPTSIEPSGRHLVRTVDHALATAGVDKSEIGLYVAHATGTVGCNNADEVVLGHLGAKAVAYGLKPLLGHTMGTAPLLELVALACASAEGVIPAPRTVTDQRHPQLAEGHFLHPGGPAVQLGLGFGGNIAATVLQPHIGSGR
jgi:3-oxoacyl-[acyl-carrier-protein] synthase II